MTQTDQLEQRITAALDRIAQGVEALDLRAPDPEPAADPAELSALRQELEAEKDSNAQLQSRVRVLRGRLRSGSRDPQGDAQRESLATLDGALQKLRGANDMLVQSNRDLRAALEQEMPDPALVNGAMKAELEAMHAARAAETAEVRAILDTLEPLLAEAAENTEEESA